MANDVTRLVDHFDERYASLHKQARAMRDALNDIDDVLGKTAGSPQGRTELYDALTSIAGIIARPTLQDVVRREV